MISIIIPVLNEQKIINGAIKRLKKIIGNAAEILVVDGDENESTIGQITDNSTINIHSSKGRARQMNTGADRATGDILLFLHADTTLPPDAIEMIHDVCINKNYSAGAFRLGFDIDHPGIRFIAFIANIRTALTKIPFGDQAIFITRQCFKAIGGFREIPLMEDVDIMKRIKQSGNSVFIIPEKVCTSARKWEEDGILYANFRNWALQFLYIIGVKPEKLVKYYYKGKK